jgi:S1-C subfamily serine protease
VSNNKISKSKNKIMSTKTKTTIFLVALVIAVSAATSLATTYVQNKNNSTNLIENAENPNQNAKARFASAVQGIETDFTIAAELTVHAVVHVKTKAPRRQQQDFFSDPFFDFFFGPQQRQQQQQQTPEEAQPLGAGSGVIISNDGYIVTNNHVVEGAQNIKVILNDKREFEARLIGADPTTDLAVLKVDEKNLPFLKYGNSDALQLGEWVLAVGNPFNLTSTVTAGIVSAKARNIGRPMQPLIRATVEVHS